MYTLEEFCSWSGFFFISFKLKCEIQFCTECLEYEIE